MGAGAAGGFAVARWKGTRFWGLTDGDGALVCVAAYRRGAEEVRRRLTAGIPPGGSPCRSTTTDDTADKRKEGGMWVDPAFPLGALTVTKGAEAELLAAGLSPGAPCVLARHVSGDWGDVPERHARANDEAAKEDGTVTSVYRLRHRRRVRVVTDLSRGVTCVMAEAEARKGGDAHATA